MKFASCLTTLGSRPKFDQKSLQITIPEALQNESNNLSTPSSHFRLVKTSHALWPAEVCSSQSHSGYVWRMKDEKNLTWPTIHTIDHVKETRKDCGYRLTKTRWILPLLSAMSVDGETLLKEWQPAIVNFSEKFTIRYNIYMHILYCII